MNSVSRLHDILTHLKKAPDDEKLGQVLVKYYGLKGGNDPRYGTILAGFLALPHQSEKLVRSMYDKLDFDLHLKSWLPPVNTFFYGMHLQEKNQAIKQKLPDHVLTSLGLVAHAVERESGSVNLKDDTLEKLKEELESIIKEIGSADDLSAACKDFITKQCQKLLEGIQAFRFFGEEQLFENLESVYGSAVTHTSEAKEATEKEGGKAFWDAVGRFATAVMLAKNIPELPGVKQIVEYLSNC